MVKKVVKKGSVLHAAKKDLLATCTDSDFECLARYFNVSPFGKSVNDLAEQLVNVIYGGRQQKGTMNSALLNDKWGKIATLGLPESVVNKDLGADPQLVEEDLNNYLNEIDSNFDVIKGNVATGIDNYKATFKFLSEKYLKANPLNLLDEPDFTERKGVVDGNLQKSLVRLNNCIVSCIDQLGLEEPSMLGLIKSATDEKDRPPPPPAPPVVPAPKEAITPEQKQQCEYTFPDLMAKLQAATTCEEYDRIGLEFAVSCGEILDQAKQDEFYKKWREGRYRACPPEAPAPSKLVQAGNGPKTIQERWCKNLIDELSRADCDKLEAIKDKYLSQCDGMDEASAEAFRTAYQARKAECEPVLKRAPTTRKEEVLASDTTCKVYNVKTAEGISGNTCLTDVELEQHKKTPYTTDALLTLQKLCAQPIVQTATFTRGKKRSSKHTSKKSWK